MQPILKLTERRRSQPIRLTSAQRQGLERHFQATIASGSQADTFIVSPGDIVGTVQIDGVKFVVAPKVPIDRVLFMVAYANDPLKWKENWSVLAGAADLLDGLAALFVQTCDRVLSQGLFRSYRRVDDEALAVRGRIRWERQSRRPAPLPLAVRYDVHDDDVLENQLVRAALASLRMMEVRNRQVAGGLARHWGSFRHLTVLTQPHRVIGRVAWTRQNEHYRPLIGLAEVILAGVMADIDEGMVPVPGFTLSMPDVFEQFVRTALREHGGFTSKEFPDRPGEHGLFLDRGQRVRLLPDLGVRRNGRWLFIGDVKYKRDDDIGRHGDLYQLFAYATAARLSEATLIYADGPADPPRHTVRNAGIELEIVRLDLRLSPSEVLAQLADLHLRRRAESHSVTPSIE